MIACTSTSPSHEELKDFHHKAIFFTPLITHEGLDGIMSSRQMISVATTRSLMDNPSSNDAYAFLLENLSYKLNLVKVTGLGSFMESIDGEIAGVGCKRMQRTYAAMQAALDDLLERVAVSGPAIDHELSDTINQMCVATATFIFDNPSVLPATFSRMREIQKHLVNMVSI